MLEKRCNRNSYKRGNTRCETDNRRHNCDLSERNYWNPHTHKYNGELNGNRGEIALWPYEGTNYNDLIYELMELYIETAFDK